MENINYYVNKVKNEKMDNIGYDEVIVYPFVEDKVCLVNKEEKNFLELKKRLKITKDLGVNITEYYDYKEENGEYYILEDLAPGHNLGGYAYDSKGQDFINNIPYEQIEKFIKDGFILENNGVGTELKGKNVMYDNEKGFTFIDLYPSEKRYQDTLFDVQQFFHNYGYFFVNNFSFSNDEYGRNIEKSMILKIIKAMEQSCPSFKKYSRWIYRSENYYSKFLIENGYDLTLSDVEYNELINLINEYIDNFIKDKEINNYYEKLNKPNALGIITSSIKYCPQFDLFDISIEGLEKYKNSFSSYDDRNALINKAFEDYVNTKVNEKVGQIKN